MGQERADINSNVFTRQGWRNLLPVDVMETPNGEDLPRCKFDYMQLYPVSDSSGRARGNTVELKNAGTARGTCIFHRRRLFAGSSRARVEYPSSPFGSRRRNIQAHG